MEKRTDAQIYIVAHRNPEYGIWDNSLYTPVQVGSAEPFTALRDNTGDNISEYNFFFAECTASYWIWKNCHPTEIKGQSQFRRRFLFEENENLSELFKDCRLITEPPLFLGNSVRGQYEQCHSKTDMELMEKIVKELYPDYSDSWDRFINQGNILFYANGFILRTEDYDAYCEWLFNLLFTFMERKGWKEIEETKKSIVEEIENGSRMGVNGHVGNDNKEGYGYQYQVGAFLSERLFTLWALHNIPLEKIKLLNYTKFENI